MDDITRYKCEVETTVCGEGLLSIQKWPTGYKVMLLDPNKDGYTETLRVVAEVESLTSARKAVRQYQEKV